MTNTAIKAQDSDLVAASDAPMVAMIERIAMDPSIPIDRLEQMLAMKERMDAKAAEKSFAAAFAAASAEFPTIPLRGKSNNGMYAKLEDIVNYTRPVLAKHGLILTWSVETDEKVKVTAKLAHCDGHSQSTTILLPADTSGSKNAVQAFGSTQKYGQRYTAQAILGLSLGDDDEDDGAAAGQKTKTITAEQFVELRDLLEKSGMKPMTFHRAFGWKGNAEPDLHLFLAANFDAAIERLNAYIEKTKGETNGAA